MNWLKEWRKVVAVVLTIVGAALFFILSVQLFAGQVHNITAQFVTHPILWAAVLAAVSLFMVSWLRDRLKLPKSLDENRDVIVTFCWLAIVLVGGLYFAQAADKFADETLKSGAVVSAMTWSAAYYAIGFLGGFLFGFPRVLQEEGDVPTKNGATVSPASSGYRQLVNTNLTQVSDWLTKIIVGLGLVELKQIPRHIYQASVWVAQTLSADPESKGRAAASFVSGLIIFFALTGFLAGYLITRLFFQGAFNRADRQVQPLPQGAQPFKRDASSDKLSAFLFSGGAPNTPNQTQLLTWLQSQGVDTTGAGFLGIFLYSENHADDRRKAVAHFSL